MLSLTESSIFAAAITCVLFCMGAMNRRQGWRRERHDLVADIRDLWAEFGSGAPAGQTLKAPVSVPAPAAAQLATMEMLRLNTALQKFGRGERVEDRLVLPAVDREELRTSGGAADPVVRYQRHAQP
jgi:hypothetical protein